MNYHIQQTESFSKWPVNLRDQRAKTAIYRHIDRAEAGNLGDVKNLGNSISEMRVDVGVGYRVYFSLRGGSIVILLAGGDKSTQQTDIQRAIQLAKEV